MTRTAIANALTFLRIHWSGGHHTLTTSGQSPVDQVLALQDLDWLPLGEDSE